MTVEMKCQHSEACRKTAIFNVGTKLLKINTKLEGNAFTKSVTI